MLSIIYNPILASFDLVQQLEIALIGMVIVFIALSFLTWIFTMIPKLLNLQVRSRLKKEGKMKEADTENVINMSAEVNAAIAMALHLYFSELHDEENVEMTIKRVSRTYSPWSSKIYAMTQNPRR